jgi:DNA-binding NarL/FixJ family response regulator
MSGKPKIRILCIDDHIAIRRLFEVVLQDHPEFDIVGSSETAEGLEERVEELHPDVVVLDLSMPGRNPLEAMSASVQRCPESKFLVMSSHDDSLTIEKSIKAGARGYVIKDGLFDSLADAIRRIARGETVAPREPRYRS